MAMIWTVTTLASPADAVVLCAKTKGGEVTGALKIRAACKRKEQQVDLASFGAVGPTGPAGTPGADGQLRIYGDGSAGARTVAADATLDDDANHQYTQLTIEAGATLTIPSGTVIRCTGGFTNSGTIIVGTGTTGASSNIQLNDIENNYVQPGPGAAPGLAGRGGVSPAGSFASGGRPPIGLSAGQARSILRPGVNAGGGGAGGTFSGGNGGGGLTVLAMGPIQNDGTLHADGADSPTGGGGGAGGIVVLASKERVENSGVITAKGGVGGGNGTSDGTGGGGGGGIVHLLAPTIDDSGSASADGGSAGTLTGTTATGTLRGGGGSGGACGGGGGSGGNLAASNAASPAQPGGAGHVLQTRADPTALY